MATVLQRGKKRFWYAIFRDLNGKQLWRRLKVKDRRSAIAAALARNEIRLVTKKTGKRLTIPMSAPLRQHVLSLPASESPDRPISVWRIK
jgi:hypothetical protein